MLCNCCGKKINISQHKENNKWKSCPKCSKLNGSEHIYYESPEMFGTTPARVNYKNPTGIQSHCKFCRSDRSVPNNIKKRLCSDF